VLIFHQQQRFLFVDGSVQAGEIHPQKWCFKKKIPEMKWGKMDGAFG